MKRRIFKNLFSLSACVVLLSCGIFIWIYYGGISAQVTSRIANQAQHYAAVLNTQGGDSTAFLSLIAGDDEERVTLIAANGAVLYDNRAELSSLDNHAARPEVAAALQSGKGDAKRRSDTFGRDIFYAAVRTRAGEVIRISKEVSDVWGILDRSAHWIFLAVIAALALSLVLSRSLTKRLLAPFATLDLQMPLQNDTYAELSPLLLRIDAQNQKIAAQLRQLSEKNRELAQVEANMNEGLVVLGSDGRVVLANRAAQRIFGTDSAQTYLQLCRESTFVQAVETVLAGKANTQTLHLHSRVYRLYANPAQPGESRHAAVLFLLDITDRERAEAMRREFSANVSHELKTPLAAVSAYAELIERGIAKQEDIAGFAAQIRKESARLLALIDDIIRISRLDEGNLRESFAPTDFAEICRNVAESLSEKAQGLGLDLSCTCEAVTLRAISPILQEMVYNLVDNAIIYNTPGGKVHIALQKSETAATLTVSDSGIGIAPEHQARVFERFYRVDKSHSKQTGGTGLGLSIVKHAALLHEASIQLESGSGKGTEIQVIFPMQD